LILKNNGGVVKPLPLEEDFFEILFAINQKKYSVIT